jgi:hypothetical protein
MLPTCFVLATASFSTPSAGAPRPKLIVFDLDNTLWTPELNMLRSLGRMSNSSQQQ